jgi:N-acyl-D-aspartate/D-glutamate deacylase
VLIVHAGNRIDGYGRADTRFSAAAVPAVRDRVRLVLSTLQPARVVSNAAAGADLIVLHEAQQLGLPVDVLIPIETGKFVRQSVADQGAEWVATFDAVVHRAEDDPQSDVIVSDAAASDDWYEAANHRLLQRALSVAAASSPPTPVLALTIRPPRTAGEVSLTDHFADLAQSAGLLVVTLDPTDGARTTRLW